MTSAGGIRTLGEKGRYPQRRRPASRAGDRNPRMQAAGQLLSEIAATVVEALIERAQRLLYPAERFPRARNLPPLKGVKSDMIASKCEIVS